MNLLLTEILACPRCGPPAVLVLLSEDTRDRRIYAGWLGCPECRQNWRVSGGFADFRAVPDESGDAAAAADAESTAWAGAAGAAGTPATDEPLRIAALLGVTEGPAFVLVAGPAARHAEAVADLVQDLEVIADLPALAGAAQRPGVSRIATAGRLPFHDGRIAGVWLSGEYAHSLLEEGARVLGTAGRLVLEPAPADAEARLAAAGLRIVARRDATTVAMRES